VSSPQLSEKMRSMGEQALACDVFEVYGLG